MCIRDRVVEVAGGHPHDRSGGDHHHRPAASRRAPGPACLPSMFDARLTLDRTTYRPGQTVQGTATFTNVSGRTCYWASTAAMVDVVGADGRSVTRAVATIADGLRWAPFEPAEVHTTTATWDQQACPPGSSPGPCAQAGPGQYTLVVTEQPFGVARAGFQLLGT